MSFRDVNTRRQSADPSSRSDASPWLTRGLPTDVQLLCAPASSSDVIGLSLQLDEAGCTQPVIVAAENAAAAMTAISEQTFDAAVLSESHGLNVSLDLAAALRAAGFDAPILLAASRCTDADWRRALALDLELLVTDAALAAQALTALLDRALARGRLQRSLVHLTAVDERRRHRDREESTTLLQQQRQILDQWALQFAAALDCHPPDASVGTDRSDERTAALVDDRLSPLSQRYHELLRTYVIMGTGTLSAEITRFCQVLAAARVSPQAVLHVHLQQVEAIVAGLGSRSSRHVMSRADLLALEIMAALAAAYQSSALTGSTSESHG